MKKEVRIIDGTRELSEKEMYEIIENGEYAVISTVDKEGIPYGFPMSYILEDNHIYFHCALDGHKIENIKYNDNVSFCIVGRTKLIPEDLDTGYESIIGFGKASEVMGDEKVRSLIKIVEKYAPKFLDMGIEEANRDQDITGVYKISIDKLTGKIRRI